MAAQWVWSQAKATEDLVTKEDEQNTLFSGEIFLYLEIFIG